MEKLNITESDMIIRYLHENNRKPSCYCKLRVLVIKPNMRFSLYFYFASILLIIIIFTVNAVKYLLMRMKSNRVTSVR